MQPTHEDVRRALEPLADLELLAWTATPDRYLLSPGPTDLAGVRSWTLSPRHTRTPVSVLLVEDRSGRLQLATGQEQVVAQIVLAQMHGPGSGTTCAHTFLKLWVEPSRGEVLVPESVDFELGSSEARLQFASEAPHRARRSWSLHLDPRARTLTVA